MAPSARLAVLQLGLSAIAAVATWQSADDDFTSLLQTTLSRKMVVHQEPLCAPIRKYYDENGRVVAEFCAPWNTTNPAWWGPRGPQQALDLERPLAEVQREHPGNLYPYFGTLNGWMSENNNGRGGSSYSSFKLSMWPPPLASPRPRQITFTWDNYQITTHMDHCTTGDDPYCYSLGWLQGQALDLKYNLARVMDNFTALNALGIEECRRMKEEFDFKDEEITLGGHIRETSDMYVKTERTCDWHPPDGGPPATSRDFNKHAYAKCFMNNVTTEIAYCYFKGCLLENNVIGHSTECDY